MARAAAFTLVEMLVVVSVILIVVLRRPAGHEFALQERSRRGGISLMLSALDQARALAIAQAATSISPVPTTTR